MEKFHNARMSEMQLSLRGTRRKHIPLAGTPSFPSSAFASAKLASLGREVKMMDWERGRGSVAWWSWSSSGGEGEGVEEAGNFGEDDEGGWWGATGEGGMGWVWKVG